MPPTNVESVIPGETLEETAARTNYSKEDLLKYFLPVELDYNFHGFSQQSFKKPPAPGIHPRIFFNPEDVEPLKNKVATNQTAKTEFENMKQWLKNSIHKEGDIQKEIYDLCVEGQTDPKILGDMFKNKLSAWWLGDYLPLLEEALRCLLEDDESAAQRLAKAIVTMTKIVDLNMNAVRNQKDWRLAKDQYHGFHGIGIVYDLIFKWLTDEQKDTIRKHIASIYEGKTGQGAWSLAAPPPNRSNWVPHIFFAGIQALSIEGEKGFNKTLILQAIDSVKKWLTFGIFPDGGSYEGLGKNNCCLFHVVPLAKRAENPLNASLAAYNYIARYYLHSIQPFDGANFNFYDEWASSFTEGHFLDVLTAKYAYPNDPAVNFVYKSYSEKYKNAPKEFTDGKVPYKDCFYRVIYSANLTDDDERLTLDEARAQMSDLPRTAIFNELGLVCTRSSWRKDAFATWFLPRSVPGGHHTNNRGAFAFSALGRVWAENTLVMGKSFAGDSAHSRYYSVVTIDDKSNSHFPAKLMKVVESNIATISVGDLKFPYTWKWSEGKEKDSEEMLEQPYTAMLHKPKHPSYELSWCKQPHWYTSVNPCGKPDGPNNLNYKAPIQNVKYAFRTLLTVYGSHQYIIVVDDIEMDDQQEHVYEWLMQIPEDLDVDSLMVSKPSFGLKANFHRGSPDNYVADMVLRECSPAVERITDSSGKLQYGYPWDKRLLELPLKNTDRDRFCLIRVLENSAAEDAAGQPVSMETYMKYVRWHAHGKRIVVKSRVSGKAPGFKVLLFPYRGDSKKSYAEGRGTLPNTVWNKDKTILRVEWEDQKDLIEFTKDGSHRTLVKLTRDGVKVDS